MISRLAELSKPLALSPVPRGQGVGALVPAAPLPAPAVDRAERVEIDASQPTASDRINHFLDKAQDSSLQHLRYAASVYAGGMIGAAIGSPICTAIGIHTGSLIAMFGGTAVVAGLGAVAGYALQYGLDHRKGTASTGQTPAPAGPSPAPAGQTPAPAGSSSVPAESSPVPAGPPAPAESSPVPAGPPAPAGSSPASSPASGGQSDPSPAPSRFSPRLASAAELLASAAAESAPPSARYSPIDFGLGLAAAFRSLPSIAYPSIEGATPAEKAVIVETLNSLPLNHATSVQTIQVASGLGNMGISGVSHPLFSQARVVLDRESMAMPDFNHELVTHETAHAVDYSTGLGPIGSASSGGKFGHGPFVSDYAKTDWLEDWAESDVKYHQDPNGLKAMSPEKFAAVDQAHHHPIDNLLDRPPVRHVGEKMGEVLGAVPGLRMTLQLGAALIAPWQIHRASRLIEGGIATGDVSRQVIGKTSLASGLMLLFPGAALGALGMNVLQYVLCDQLRRGKMTPQKADQVANRALAIATGPVGMVGLVANDELARAGIARKPRDPGVQNVSGGSMLKGMLWTVGGGWAGAVAGASIGAAVSGAAGGALGMYWGLIGGATLSLCAYGAHLARQTADPNDPLALTADDKKFLRHVAGGAIVGGTVGTAVGAVGGELVGHALGLALGGPGCASLGSWAGRIAGVFAGSYGMARAGAWIGRHLNHGRI